MERLAKFKTRPRAIQNKKNYIQFVNQIELIQQEIQTMLALARPHDSHVYEQNAISKMTDYEVRAQVFLRASAMHALSSVLGAVEHQKGTNHLEVAVQKDSYYEVADTLKAVKTFKLHLLDGDKFNNKESFHRRSKALDLFICEFHHNISKTRRSYSPEKVTEQILSLIDSHWASQAFTVAIDSTISNPRDIQLLLTHPRIAELIRSGRINLVLFKSAQKFDMLGVDNYNGGVVQTFNQRQHFLKFNERMRDPSDQLTGLSYQGLAHLQKHGGDSAEQYQKALRENTKFFYDQIPYQMIFHDDVPYSPIQFAQIDSSNPVFLQLKIPNPDIEYFFSTALFKKDQISGRASFGFPTTNYVSVASDDGNEVAHRLTPGLEDQETLIKYSQIFRQIQEYVDQIRKEDPTLTPHQIDEKTFKFLNERSPL